MQLRLGFVVWNDARAPSPMPIAAVGPRNPRIVSPVYAGKITAAKVTVAHMP